MRWTGTDRGHGWALALALALLAATPASAAVEVGKRIEVIAPDGSHAVIKRSPLRISFHDPDGGRVLAQAGKARGAPTVLPVTSQNMFGAQQPPPPTEYRPFGFLVGSQDVTQHTAVPQWFATLSNVARGGTIYGATRVERASRSRGGVDLRLATNDPGGREIEARIAPRGEGGLRVSASVTPRAGVATIADSFSSSRDEAFHGFGGRHDYIDQRGQSFYNWLQQQNVGSGSTGALTAPADPERDRYLFPNGSSAAYYVQSSFVSDEGYGFLLDRDEISHWRMASDRDDAWQVEVGAGKLDYTVMPGSAKRAAAAISQLNGRHRVPPKWAQGSLLVRSVNFPNDTPAGYLARVRDDIREIEKTGTPVDAYGIEGWEFLSDSELSGVVADLRALGIKPMLYFRLFVGKDEIGTDDPADYDHALANGYVATHADGSPYVFTSNFFEDAAMIDFTDPRAIAWWQGRIRTALQLGARGFMQDFGEQVMADMHFDDGSTGARMHNRLAVLAHRATREELDRWQRETGARPFFYTRGGYSGTPGAAAFENANFAGDSTTDYSRASGLASLTTDMLNRAVGGSFGFTTDIGGYFDIGPYPPTSKQLFIRWAEWAALSPLFRLHGSVAAGTHMPWTFDRETVRTYRRLARLHLKARPYVRDLWKRAVRGGPPPTRPLWLQYPRDEHAAGQDQQWMLGSRVLVAPVVVEDATERRTYFPEGCWQHPETGKRFEGPGHAKVASPLGLLPYFFRCGERPFEPPRACESIDGTNRDDVLRGGGGDERIRGRRGNDTIDGGRGNDCLDAGPGDDRTAGGSGGDLIFPGRGADRVLAGAGNDAVRGGPGRDRIAAGSGSDWIRVSGGGADVVDCGAGDDVVLLTGRDRARNCERVERR
jgi:alpha-glucosidase